MSQNTTNMLEGAIAKLREAADVNSVIGDPIVVDGGITIIPVSKVSIGFGGAGSDYVSKHPNKLDNHPFGGGTAGGVKVTPVAFLIVKDGNVRMIPVATPANTTVDRLVEQIPDVLDRISAFVEDRLNKKEG